MNKLFSSLGKIGVVFSLAVVSVACSGNAAEPVVSDAPSVTVEDTAVPSTSIPATNTPQPETAVEAVPAEPETKPIEVTAEPTNEPTPTQPTIEPIAVTYFTPAQQEGPYYTVDKPDDRDNDLTVTNGAAGAPAGDIVEFGGQLYDATGMPVAGAVIEIWQTDDNGVYLHPGDPETAQRDMNFQFYGEAVTAVDGSYNFRTILPGEYEPRPRHIHVKVKLSGQELLTTQFYFAGNTTLGGELISSSPNGDDIHLVVNLVDGQDTNGNPILSGERDIVLSVNLSNN